MALIVVYSCVLVLFTLVLSKSFYNIFFHPLRRYPGPWYCSISNIWYSFHSSNGRLARKISSLHERYGHVVRIAPNELSYTSLEAWKEIYGRNMRTIGSSKPTPVLFTKDQGIYGSLFRKSSTLIDAQGHLYRQEKRSLASEFTPKSILAQDPVRLAYLDRLMDHLNSLLHSSAGKMRIDIVPWIGNAIFDISCKLTIGTDFDAISRGGSLHPAIKRFKTASRSAIIYSAIRRLSGSYTDVLKVVSRHLSFDTRSFFHQLNVLRPTILERIQKGRQDTSEWVDIVNCLLDKSKEEGPDIDIVNTASLFIVIPCETLITFTTGTLYYIMSSPVAHRRVSEEIRQSFMSLADITTTSTQSLEYLDACMKESIRIFPPFRGILPRVVCEGGATICGNFVPEYTTVGVHMWSTFHSQKNFLNHDQFLPERWLDTAGEYASDVRESVQAWGFGPWTCIAKEYSMMITKVLLARLLWKFDFKLDEKFIDWATERKAFGPVEISPLYVEILRSPNS